MKRAIALGTGVLMLVFSKYLDWPWMLLGIPILAALVQKGKMGVIFDAHERVMIIRWYSLGISSKRAYPVEEVIRVSVARPVFLPSANNQQASLAIWLTTGETLRITADPAYASMFDDAARDANALLERLKAA